MGISSDAILCYGFTVGEEDEPPEWLKIKETDPVADSDTMEFEDFVAKLHEIDEPNGRDWEDQRPQVWEAYWQAKRDAVKAEGVEIVYHCHSEYTMRILAVTTSVKTASRGCPFELEQELESAQVRMMWHEKLRRFCERAGIPFENEDPQWLLCSWWA